MSEPIKKDFVYIGHAILSDGKLGISLRPVGEDGKLEEVMSFEPKNGRRNPTVIGGIYRGASFSPERIHGLGDVTFTGDRWQDKEQRVLWQAASDDAEEKIRARRLEKEQGNEIEELLLPLRKQYASAVKRFDYTTRETLERAVLRALKTLPRKDEE